MKLSKKYIRFIVAVGIVIFLTANKGFRNLISRMIEYRRINQEILEIRRKNQELEKEIQLLENDESYIEYYIRKELGYLKEGEVEYRFEPEK